MFSHIKPFNARRACFKTLLHKIGTKPPKSNKMS